MDPQASANQPALTARLKLIKAHPRDELFLANLKQWATPPYLPKAFRRKDIGPFTDDRPGRDYDHYRALCGFRYRNDQFCPATLGYVLEVSGRSSTGNLRRINALENPGADFVDDTGRWYLVSTEVLELARPGVYMVVHSKRRNSRGNPIGRRLPPKQILPGPRLPGERPARETTGRLPLLPVSVLCPVHQHLNLVPEPIADV